MTKDKPLVSILIPVYNVEQYIRQCLDSVVTQTYRNLQIVLIDDGSKDNSLSICNSYAEKDNRIEVYHQENQGVAATRNNLLSHILGEYVLFIDSDDWIEPNMVEYLLYLSQEHNADISICGTVTNDGNGAPIVQSEIKTYTTEQAIERFLYHKEFRGSLSNKLAKAILLHKEQFQCGINYGEDALFCWHIMQHADIIVYSETPLYHYRMVDTSLCHSSFGPKKLSGHYVWEQICNETEQWWPKYLNIAQARHCVEDVLLLRDAAHCHYKQMNEVRMLQQTILHTWHTLNIVKITSVFMKLYAFVACRSFWFASKI